MPVAARCIHGFGGDVGSRCRERGEDAAGVKPARAVLVAEDRLPIEVAGLDLADGGVAAIGAAGGGAHAESALGEVEAVAHGAADAVVRNPVEQGGIDAALQDEVFNEAADGVVGERGGDGGAQAEAAAQAAGHVVFAAALPHLELARGVDAAFAGIEAEHDFAEAEAIPAAVRIGKRESGSWHRSASTDTLTHRREEVGHARGAERGLNRLT